LFERLSATSKLRWLNARASVRTTTRGLAEFRKGVDDTLRIVLGAAD
jgi:hypothetical protein